MYSLNNKIAVVTGAGSGIGQAICKKLALMGALVIVTDINLEAANDTLKSLSVLNDFQKHESMQLDVNNSKQIKSVFQEIGNRHGRIDIAANNAGVSTIKNFEDLTEQDWDFNLDVNAKGIFLCMQAEVPYMKKNGGKIINTASVAGLRGYAFGASYNSSKFAVVGLTQTCAIELAKYNITVNCVCPCYVKTSMEDREVEWEAKLRNIKPEEVRQGYIDATPLGRLCDPGDVANIFGFLASSDADFITGAALPITGGADLL